MAVHENKGVATRKNAIDLTDALVPQYRYLDSKVLAPVVCFADLVQIGLRTIWAEQHAPYTRFLPRRARKESNVHKLKKSLAKN